MDELEAVAKERGVGLGKGHIGQLHLPGPFEKSEKRAWYLLFAHPFNFPTFQEFRIIPRYPGVP